MAQAATTRIENRRGKQGARRTEPVAHPDAGESRRVSSGDEHQEAGLFARTASDADVCDLSGAGLSHWEWECWWVKVAARGAGPAQAAGGSVLTSASRRAIFPGYSPGPDPSVRPPRAATRRHGHRHTADTPRSGTDSEPTDSTCCHPSLATSFSPAAVGITCQPLRWCKNPTHTPKSMRLKWGPETFRVYPRIRAWQASEHRIKVGMLGRAIAYMW